MVNKVRTIDFLPEIFQTPTNRQFLNASLDVLTSQPNLKRVQGFIGEKYGYGVEPNDRYVVEPTKSRTDYQLDPSVVFLKKDTQKAQDFISYPGIVSSLRNEGGIVDNNDRLFSSEFYSWDPFIDYDKIVNYTQYYWIPKGPDAVPVLTSTVYDEATYTITGDIDGYTFSGVGGKNTTLTLLRGGTYQFVLDGSLGNFWIQKVPGISATTVQRTIPGCTNNGISNGTITFVVPDKSTLVNDVLWYQNGVDPDSIGYINLIESNSDDYIDVDQILDKKTYFSPNGVEFTNGLKVSFDNTALPVEYRNNEYYVEGVGSSITLLPVTDFLASERAGTTAPPGGFDVYSVETYIDPEYLTIGRDSRDYNGWTRTNRWFHTDVINITAAALGQVTTNPENTVSRAQRPILEFRGNLQLFNSGSKFAGFIDILSLEINDAFTQVEGKTILEVGTISGVQLFDGARIVFAADGNPLVRGAIYIVNLIPTTDPLAPIINLVEDTFTPVTDLSQVAVYKVAGNNQGGTTWWFNGTTGYWVDGQRKTTVNQSPYYDVFNNVGVSFGNEGAYPGNSFRGSTLFSYTSGSGPDDPVLGFPITYSSIESIGDILFTVNFNSDQFSYQSGVQEITQNVNTGFVRYNRTSTVSENLTGWVRAAADSFQYQVFEFNQIKQYIYSSANTGIEIVTGGNGYQVGDKLVVGGNLLGGSSPANDLTLRVSAVTGGSITGFDLESISGVTTGEYATFNAVAAQSMTGGGSSAVLSVLLSGPGTTTFKCDVLAKEYPLDTQWNPIVVYYNDNILDTDYYTVARDTIARTTSITVDTTIGSKITVLLYSSDISKTGYYQIPSNLGNNPYNTDITSVAIGDLKNQYRTIFSNAPGTTGSLFGSNNLHNLGPILQWGTAIIQNSASLVLPGVFLRKPETNLFKSLQFNKDQYQNYKALLIDLAISSDYNASASAADVLDDIVYQITTIRGESTPFFWSDMIPSGNPYKVNEYYFSGDTGVATFSLSPEVWSTDLFSRANYRSVNLYLKRTVNGQPYNIQLIRGLDWTVSTEPDTPIATLNYPLEAGDTVVVKEYNQTYGSYCPSTPSKLGLYPIFMPGVVQPPNTDQYYIKGHDGSLTKLWGTYVVDPVSGLFTLDDFRDEVLLEFETRVFNNFKVSGSIPLQGDDVIPGQGRVTEYSWDNILKIYGPEFLNWIGLNRIEYRNQLYRQDNKYTWNYNQTTNKIDGSVIKQGYWKGVYRWLYDTENPAGAPWEMLGFPDQPDWWTSRYGAAPYTSGNTYMWQEISEGYVWNDGNPYVDSKRVRPYLLETLPVDSYGNLLPPFNTVAGNYNSLTFNTDWVVGDGSPVESAYLDSSNWPFDLMRLLALTKPAKFFNLFVDRDDYKFNDTLVTPGQYLYNDRYHLDPRTINIYGNGTAKHSYINWVVDYNYQRGADGYTAVEDLLKNTDVRLTYNAAGFTSKNYLKFLVEKATPNSRNTSLLIPDENYTVLLYDNPPEDTVVYSSVIVQKTANGYTVWGNSKNQNYFTTVTPKIGNYKKFVVATTTVQISPDYYPDQTTVVPYGTQLYSVQSVAQFLINYSNYLQLKGVKFKNIISGVPYDWWRMAEEFVAWSQSEWEVGSIISLNPNARNFTVERPGLVPQPLTLEGQNFVLNENLLPIQNGDLCIVRDNEILDLTVLTAADTIAYSVLNLNSIEHAIVFDNYTSFGDTIFNIDTGLRQSRLLLQGYKTGEWTGYINTDGFILNENNVKEWQPNIKYPKNKIVTFKGKYYSARQLIEPAPNFFLENWVETDYDQIKEGLLPNPSTTAYEALFYYDTTRANLENDADLLGFSLIGFRPREYMAAADLSDITQVNVYKNIVREKGTTLLAESFRGAQFERGEIDYIINENWAIKDGDFGAVLNNNYIEARLNQAELKGNPTLVGFSPTGGTTTGVQQVVPLNQIINWERPPLTADFMPLKQGSYTLESGLSAAGYVNIGDSKVQKYTLEDLLADTSVVANIRVGDYIWIANYKETWDILEVTPLDNQIVTVQNNLNSTATINFNSIHGLKSDDIIGIIDFNSTINGFYLVKTIPSITSIVVNVDLGSSTNLITGLGTGFKLVSRRYEQASDGATSTLPVQAWSNRKLWADLHSDGQWAVWGAGISFKQETVTTGSGNYGISVASGSEIGNLVANGSGGLYRYWGNGNTQSITGSGVGQAVEVRVAGQWAYCSSPAENRIYVYRINAVTGLLNLQDTILSSSHGLTVTGAIAVGGDNQWLYIADSINQRVAVYLLNESLLSYSYVTTLTDPSIAPGSGWGTSISTGVDGVKLVVGAPNETVNTLAQAGAAYVYTRGVQRFYGDGATTVFTLLNAAPNNLANIYVNDVLVTGSATVSGSTATVQVQDPLNPSSLIPPPAGSIITVDTGYMEFVQRFQSDQPRLGALYGNSVETNRYGSDVIVGAPFEINTVDNVGGVEGAVYRYTNGGQRYGVVTSTVTGTSSGQILVDGYIVTYSGTISSIRDSINNQTPTNIIATSSGSTLTITVKQDTPEVLYNIIDITGQRSYLLGLGIVPYTKTQVITNLNLTNTGKFGFKVKMNERDSLLISAPSDIYKNPTTFDYTDDCVENDTIFDGGGTTFIDTFTEQGVVYLYDYLPAYNEGISNPGKYAFGQYISTGSITPGTPSPDFGITTSYYGDQILIGIPDWTSTTGAIINYSSTWEPQYECQHVRPTSWYIDKQPLPVVDINLLSDISIYDYETNQTLEWLDFIDPLQGKLLGAVETNIDYIGLTDPAVYNTTGISWTIDHVGDTWLDTNTVRLLNYHQPDSEYNAKNWGKCFPGSTADIYTWIESVEPPLGYSGSGIPIGFDSYTTATTVDDATNSLITKYYYWVKNYDGIPPGKNLSPLVLGEYILNPLNSGISFLAPITTNIVGLFNSGEYIRASSSILHVGYGTGGGLDDKHTSWSLIRSGDPDDFLNGVPNILGEEPTGLYLKYIESFSGFDLNENPVPDPRLPLLVRYGTQNRPRQGMYIDRLTALETYIEYANNLLIRLPIVEMRDISYLELNSEIFDVRRYWAYENWWSEGYNNETKASIEVSNVNDLQVINQNQLLTSVAGTNIYLIDGLIAKVAANAFGRSEYYVYSSTSSQAWTRIGAENSTIQISPLIYQLYGWDSEPWGLVWDKTPSREITWVIRWLNEVCYTNELAIDRNKSLLLMFNYIQSESLLQNNYLPWLNKTSLIDVKHKIRDLLPYKKYQRDNQEFLEGFINEIKPYHVLVKDFTYSYEGQDTWNGNITDFDLPATYNTTSDRFITPQLIYSGVPVGDQYTTSSIIWDNPAYIEWFNNYGLTIDQKTQTTSTTLAEPLLIADTEISVVNVTGLPSVGTIQINSERISYTGLNYVNNTVTGLTRGVDGTSAANHTAGTPVKLPTTAVIVFNSGRGYTQPPILSASNGPGTWPTPRTDAVLQPVLNSTTLTGVEVDNPGSGYVTTPVINIQDSSITESVPYTDINIVNNTITITAHPFITGDVVVYSNATPPIGLVDGGTYYVRVVDPNTITLHRNIINTTISAVSPYLHISTSDGRIDLLSQGSGTGTLTTTARTGAFTTSKPVREFTVTVKFDRVSYGYDEGATTAAGRIAAYYQPTLSMPGKILPQLEVGVEYPNGVWTGAYFADAWDMSDWSEYGWDGVIDNPDTEVILDGGDFTPIETTNYDIEGDPFPDGYTPEELVGQYVTDSVIITVTSDDLASDWTHQIRINVYGQQGIYNNSGQLAEATLVTSWWYGIPGTNPATDPSAATSLSTNTGDYAVFLRA